MMETDLDFTQEDLTERFLMFSLRSEHLSMQVSHKEEQLHPLTPSACWWLRGCYPPPENKVFYWRFFCPQWKLSEQRERQEKSSKERTKEIKSQLWNSYLDLAGLNPSVDLRCPPIIPLPPPQPLTKLPALPGRTDDQSLFPSATISH